MNTKQKIAATASRLFHEKGFAATSVREIAAAVGIEAASLYNHISSKTDLLDRICFDIAERFEEHLTSVEAADCQAPAKLNAILQFHIDLALHDPMVLTVFSQEWRHLPDDKRSVFQSHRRDYEKRVQNIFQEGQKHMQIDPGLDAEIGVKMLLSSIQWVYFSKIDVAAKNEKQIRETVELFVKNIVEKLTSVSA